MTADEVREGITQLVDGSITAHFERKGKEKITYSHRPHTKAETRYVITRQPMGLLMTSSLQSQNRSLGRRECPALQRRG